MLYIKKQIEEINLQKDIENLNKSYFILLESIRNNNK